MERLWSHLAICQAVGVALVGGLSTSGRGDDAVLWLDPLPQKGLSSWAPQNPTETDPWDRR